MKTHYINSNDEVEINITPMLDVVFIMLIFFIVTTSFTKEIGLSLFKSNNAIIERHKVKNAIVKLDINDYTVNGLSTTLDGIQSLLANLKASNPNIQIQIIASPEIKTGDLVQVIHQVKVNNIVQYSVSSF